MVSQADLKVRLSERDRHSGSAFVVFVEADLQVRLRRGQLLFQQLFAIELRVQALSCHQLVVRAPLDDPSLIDDENLIGATYRRDAMRDDERRPLAQDA